MNRKTTIECNHRGTPYINGIGNKYIILQFSDTLIILDEQLKEICTLEDVFGVNSYENDNYYAISYYTGINRNILKLSKNTCRVINFGSQELDNIRELWITSMKYDRARLENRLKYALAIGGCIASKEYSEIAVCINHSDVMITLDDVGSKDVKLNDMHNNEITIHVNGYNKQGIISKNGKELLEPMANSIEYIGNNNFVIKTDDKAFIYNTDIHKIIIGPVDVNNIIIHKTLPITIINNNNNWIILDVFNRTYRFEELHKYFDCKYCKSKPNIIKVSLNYGTKYVDNRLTAITNIHEIAKFQSEEWIQM